MTLFKSGRLGVISKSYTTSPAVLPKCWANGWPTTASAGKSINPEASPGNPSSAVEHIMPCDSTPRSLPTLMVKGGVPGGVGSVQPGVAKGTLSPSLKFFAPHTIWRSPWPSFTRQTDNLSAFGCLAIAMTCATTTPSNSPPSFCMDSTSTPSMVSRSRSSSGVQLKSTCRRNQLIVTFIGGKN